MYLPEILPAPKPMQPCEDVCVARKIDISKFEQDYEYLHDDGQWRTTTSGDSSTGYFSNWRAAEAALAKLGFNVPRKIIVSKRTHDYHACFEKQTEYWGCGDTPDEAIGALVHTHFEQINVIVEFA